MDINSLLMSSASLSTFMLTLIILVLPLLSPNSKRFLRNTKNAIQLSFFTSLWPATLMLIEPDCSSATEWEWLNFFYASFPAAITLDIYSTLFIPIALLVTWSIIDFSLWYMHDDPKISLFFKYMLIFLLMMIVLTTTENLLILFIGWEGVGIMSFLLIGWYFARDNAGTAALQAVLYNRIGDIGMLFTLFWLMSTHHATELAFLLLLKDPTPISLAFIIAAASKSAQFGFHPWLASAMEGPTPVSALLHSSTMVVAGVFLLIRVQPLMEDNETALTTCLCLGAISTAFAAACALTQNDIKKIIAYSTASQLGLMMVAIGLNMPNLAFFHICTHAFFKAMLFLSSGSIIHNLHGEQDIRKMGALYKILPVTSASMTIGSLALMGTPYLAGFFSKDAIIEAMSTSHVNTFALLLTFMATSFTAIYSLRIIFFTSAGHPRVNPMIYAKENKNIIFPLSRLVLGSIMAGLIINHIMPLSSAPTTLTLPPHMKMAALAATLLGFILALDLTAVWTDFPKNFNLTKLLNTSFLSIVTHRLLSSMTLSLSLKFISQLIDSLWLEKVGPKGLVKNLLPLILKSQKTQKGLIKIYLSSIVLAALICIIALQLA